MNIIIIDYNVGRRVEKLMLASKLFTLPSAPPSLSLGMALAIGDRGPQARDWTIRKKIVEKREKREKS